MALITRALGILRQTATPRITNKAWASQTPVNRTKPLSGKDQAIGLVTMFAVFLIPSGWILSHLEDYKNRK